MKEAICGGNLKTGAALNAHEMFRRRQGRRRQESPRLLLEADQRLVRSPREQAVNVQRHSRADLAGNRVTVGRLYSVAEMLDHAADLLSDYAGLVHDNERRWRVFHGGGANLESMDQYAKQLGDGRHVVAMDVRSCGQSGDPEHFRPQRTQEFGQ
jgi:hypothetical protein